MAWTRVGSPIGPLTLVGGAAGLRAVWFDGQAQPALDQEDRVHLEEHVDARDRTIRLAARAVARAAQQLGDYFSGSRAAFDLPLDLGGTPFQQRVWAALLAIPCGQTRTYGAIAAEITAERPLQPTSARAVAAAVGRTPAPIIVPCHRVIGGGGSLTGYRGGLPRKRALLELEGAAIVAGPGSGPLARATAASGETRLL